MSVKLDVLWNRLIAIVEEQAQALIRTAFSTSVREAGDLSAGVYDAKGAMLAQAVTGTPGHVNAMAEAVGHFIEAIGRETMVPGDVYITNDPWRGTGHLHDITVVTPVFHDLAHIGFFACTAHVVDIGGRGFGADANSVYEEGIFIPILRFASVGEVNNTLVSMIRAGVREPEQVVGDIFALAACNRIGEERLEATLAEFGISDLQAISDHILTTSKTATINAIAALDPGDAAGEMTIDGFAAPIRLAARVEIQKDRVICDFDGTSPVDPKGINVPMVYTRAYAAYAMKCAIAPEIPNNAGSLEPFRVTAPEGTIVNAPFPTPVALRHIIGHMVPDTVFAALAQLLPGRIPAEGAGCLCNFQVSLRRGKERSEVLAFNSGGSGARPSLDGMSATAFPSGVMTMPVEATEHAGPLIVWRKELRPDSGGLGRQRGGLGQFMEVGARDGWRFDISAMLDRVDHPARGRDGGGPGGATEIGLDDGTVLRGKGRQPVPQGARVRMAFPGGGGFGPAGDRDPADLARDVARGYVSPNAARQDWGADDDLIATAEDAARKGEEP